MGNEKKAVYIDMMDHEEEGVVGLQGDDQWNPDQLTVTPGGAK